MVWLTFYGLGSRSRFMVLAHGYGYGSRCMDLAHVFGLGSCFMVMPHVLCHSSSFMVMVHVLWSCLLWSWLTFYDLGSFYTTIGRFCMTHGSLMIMAHLIRPLADSAWPIALFYDHGLLDTAIGRFCMTHGSLLWPWLTWYDHWQILHDPWLTWYEHWQTLHDPRARAYSGLAMTRLSVLHCIMTRISESPLLNLCAYCLNF